MQDLSTTSLSRLGRVARIGIVPILFVACISGGGDRPYPLYPQMVSSPPREQLAHLTGYVQVVDGRDVSSLGTSFDLLPGPHVVQTPSHWGHTELNIGGMSANTGHLVYKLQMRPGYFYMIKVELEKTDGTMGRYQVVAYESDAQGVQTQSFYPIGRAD